MVPKLKFLENISIPFAQAYSPPLVDRIFSVYGDLIIVYPKPYSIYLRGTIILRRPLAAASSTVRLRFEDAAPGRWIAGVLQAAMIQVIYRDYIGDDEKENGNYYITRYILGLYKDNVKENGNYYLMRVHFGAT